MYFPKRPTTKFYSNIGYQNNDARKIVIKINNFNRNCYGIIKTEDKIESKHEDPMHDEL